MIYDLQHFIDKFEGKSEAEIITGTVGMDGGPKCANGWCGAGLSHYGTPETEALERLLEILTLSRTDGVPAAFPIYLDMNAIRYSRRAEFINDGWALEYQQPTPKQRILAALYDIKKMQSKDTDTGGKKERIIYVSVPVSITEQARELLQN
jgi:hypothetical protein